MNSQDSIVVLGRTLFGKIGVCTCALFACLSAHAETWTQTAADTYNWGDIANWGGASFPDAIGSTANISGDFTGAQTINLNTAITVGSLTLNDSGGSSDSGVTLATGTSGSLTLQVASGSASITNSSVAVTNTISAPVVFASDTIINPGSSSSSANFTTLSLSGGFSGAGNVTVTGTASGSGRSTVVLGGANTGYTGNWTLSGTSGSSAQGGAGISISQDSNLGAVPVSPGTNITVSNSGAIRFSAAVTLNANRNILLNSGSTLVLLQDTGATSDIAGVISGTGGIRINSGASTRVIRLSGTNTYTGASTITTGKLQAGSTGAFGVNSAFSLADTSAAVLDLNGFSNAIGSLSGGGTAGGNITLGAATLTTGGLNANTTYAGIISGTGGFTKTGTGTQTLSGANTYTGATTVGNGILALGAAERISDSSDLVLASGGTFATGGFNETLDTLTVNGNSILDFGSGSSALVFAASNSLTWTGTLTLLNFDIGTDSLKFGTSVSALSLAQLESISLAGYTAALDSNGFVTFSVIPEPSTYAALTGVFVLSLAVFRSRKRN